MTRPVIVVIEADPRVSHRANEAMRIGLGIVSGENEVTFVLTGAGVHLLDGDTDDLVDGDDIGKFRGVLKSLGVPFHVDRDSLPDDPDWNTDGHPVMPVTRADVAKLVRQGRRCLVF